MQINNNISFGKIYSISHGKPRDNGFDGEERVKELVHDIQELNEVPKRKKSSVAWANYIVSPEEQIALLYLNDGHKSFMKKGYVTDEHVEKAVPIGKYVTAEQILEMEKSYSKPLKVL